MAKAKKKEKKKVEFVEGLKAKEVQEVPLEDIKTDDKAFQYRFTTRVGDLKNSLQVEGQREPIDLTGSKPYRIIDGFRRVEALRALGWNKVKALVHKGISEEEARKLAFIKNVVRKNLSPIEKGNAIYQAKLSGMKAKDLSEFFGMSERQVLRYQELLEFPAEVQKLLVDEKVNMEQAKVLSDFKPKDLDGWVKKIADESITAKQLKRLLKKELGVKPSGRAKIYMKKQKDGIRMYPFTISKSSPQAEREKVVRLLKAAIDAIVGR